MDQDAAFEKRLIALERRQTSNQNLYLKLKRDIVDLWQELWAGVIDTNITTPTPTPTPTPTCPDGYTGDFSEIIPCIPTSLTVVDSKYGNTTIVYDAATGTWSGCKVVSFAGSVLCAARAGTPIRYTLFGDAGLASWAFKIEWLSSVGCPATGTCSSTLNTSPTNTNQTVAGGTTVTWGQVVGPLYAPTGNGTWSITFP